jgi:hypothetical protein
MCPQRSPAEARSASTFSGARGVAATVGFATVAEVAFASAGAEDSDAFASALSAGADTRVSVTVGSVFFVGDGDAVEEGSGYCEWLAVLEGLGLDEEFSL